MQLCRDTFVKIKERTLLKSNPLGKQIHITSSARKGNTHSAAHTQNTGNAHIHADGWRAQQTVVEGRGVCQRQIVGGSQQIDGEDGLAREWRRMP